MDQQPFTRVSIQVLPNLRQQQRRTRQHQDHADEQEEPQRRLAARFSGSRFTHTEAVVKEHVQTEIVWEKLRRDHQSESYSARRIVTTSDRLIERRRLLGAHEEVESKEHEEDEQRIFLANPVVSNCIDADSPKRGR